MIILPDRNVPRSKFILPVPKKEWMIPSLAQPKDQLGNEDRRYFVIRAHAHDGKIVWRGVYENRNDFDAVLWAIANDTLRYEKELWPLSTPNWDPWIGELPQYSFVTYDIKTSPTGSNQTYNKPSDWNDSNNKVECIGGGGSGGAVVGSNVCTGSGGGSYSQILNFSFTGSSATYQIGSGGITQTASPGNGFNGIDGGITWFNATSDPGVGTDNTKCSADSGKGGKYSTSGGSTSNGGVAGSTTLSWGQTKYNGGGGGYVNTSSGSSGSGGSGCSNGAGDSGVNTTAAASNGGAGGVGDSGVGSPGTRGSGTGSSRNGGNGSNLADGTVGSGGGAASSRGTSAGATITGWNGGNYGGGGSATLNDSGSGNSGTKAVSGLGGGGLIIISYTPQTYRSGSMFILFN